MPVTTSRRRVLAYLRKTRAASADEIASALDVTPADARHHLGILVGDGLVTVTGDRREGRGRPAKLYALSSALAGDNLPGLLDAALSEWLGPLGEAERSEALRSLARRVGEAWAGEWPSMAKRLSRTVERLNKLHYAARWEAGAEGPRVILGQCPYAAIIAKHPELCQMDAGMLELALQSGVEQKAKLHPACIFHVG